MKKNISIIILICFFPIYFSSAKEDLIAYWSFDDGTARDFSGNGYDGTIVFHPKFIPGIKGKAIWLQGRGYYAPNNNINESNMGDHVLLPYIDFYSLKEFTITMWVKEEGMSSPGGEGYIWFGHVQNKWLGLLNHVYYGKNERYLHTTVGSYNTDNCISIVSDTNYMNKWVFYSMIYKNGVLKFYIDGKLIGEKKMKIDYSDKHAALGRHWWTYDSEERTSARFTGAIDEVKIYKHALTIEEIKEEFDGPSLYFQFPDTLATIGKDICLPMTYHTSSVIPLPDSTQYKITISIDKSILWPDMNSSGYIVGDKRFFEFEGNLNMLNNKSTKICGTALLGNNKTAPIHFENIDILHLKSNVFTKDGSLTLTGICQQAISRVQSMKSPELELRQINFSNSVKAILKLYDDANIDYSIYNIYGEKIIHKELGLIQKNRRELLINIINLQSGIYFIRFNINRFLFTKKLIIIDK